MPQKCEDVVAEVPKPKLGRAKTCGGYNEISQNWLVVVWAAGRCCKSNNAP